MRLRRARHIQAKTHTMLGTSHSRSYSPRQACTEHHVLAQHVPFSGGTSLSQCKEAQLSHLLSQCPDGALG